MSSPLRFGTSGWRAIIADEFTVANARRVVAAIARYVVSAAGQQGPSSGPSLVVGYDPRFLSETFAALASEEAARHGIRCYLSPDPTPTPAVAFAIRQRGADGGINFTASHNPAEYNGIKFSMANGAPALPEVTRRIEAEIANPSEVPLPVSSAPIEAMDLRPAYLDDLAQKVNLDAIRTANLRLVCDPLYGAGRGYLDGLLERVGVSVTSLHDRRDVLFGGHPPDPAEEHLAELRQAMTESGAHLGLATDGDADRFGILDEGGAFVSPNHILALLLDYLVESRQWTADGTWPGGVAKSVATTHLINAVAEHHKIPLYETPVGFKYIGELIEQDKIILGGEESAGTSIRRHVPEKDGILACLLTAEMVATRRMPLSRQLEALFHKVGSYYPGRWNVPLTEPVRIRFTERSREEYSSLEGRRVARTDRTDGLKLIFEDGSWVLFRLSGTEPVCRLYCEAPTRQGLGELAATARKFLFG